MLFLHRFTSQLTQDIVDFLQVGQQLFIYLEGDRVKYQSLDYAKFGLSISDELLHVFVLVDVEWSLIHHTINRVPDCLHRFPNLTESLPLTLFFLELFRVTEAKS